MKDGTGSPRDAPDSYIGYGVTTVLEYVPYKHCAYAMPILVLSDV